MFRRHVSLGSINILPVSSFYTLNAHFASLMKLFKHAGELVVFINKRLFKVYKRITCVSMCIC